MRLFKVSSVCTKWNPPLMTILTHFRAKWSLYSRQLGLYSGIWGLKCFPAYRARILRQKRNKNHILLSHSAVEVCKSKQLKIRSGTWGILTHLEILGLELGNFPCDFPSRRSNSSSAWKGRNLYTFLSCLIILWYLWYLYIHVEICVFTTWLWKMFLCLIYIPQFHFGEKCNFRVENMWSLYLLKFMYFDP